MTERYPSIGLNDLTNFIHIIEQAIEDPTYLDITQCPYDKEIMERLRKLVDWTHPLAGKTTEEQKNPVGRPSKQVILPIDEVQKEVEDIRKDLNQLKLDSTGLETADKIQIIKTRAALVEKIIAMKERIGSIKKQQNFISTVIGVMEDVMEQKQREEVIKKLEPYIDE